MQDLPLPKFRIWSLVVAEYDYNIKFLKITEMEYQKENKMWIYYSESSFVFDEDELRKASDYEKWTYF